MKKFGAFYVKSILCVLLSIMGSQGYSQIMITKKDVTCRGGNNGQISVNVLNATPPITYAWNDGFTGQNRNSLAAGTYVVTVTDATKCDHTKAVVIAEPDEVLKLELTRLTTPPPIECHTPIPVYYRAEAFGGTPLYKLNGQTAQVRVYKFSSTTDFTFSVTDKNGCTAEKKRKILVGAYICAVDPNDISGPSGYDTAQWVSVNDTLPYTIRFENDPLVASGPAKEVLITHEIDDDLNPYTFRLGSFGFGNFSFEVPPHLSSFQKRFDFTNEAGFYVDVVAGLDVENLRAFWRLTTVDPLTNQPPTDPFIGFLPVNDTLTGSGEGFVSFTLKPKSSAMTGDTAVATASIIFDGNDPIITNTWENRIDAFPPTTFLNDVDSLSLDHVIPLNWYGDDDPGGSGLAFFELYVSKDDGPYEMAFLTESDTLSYLFSGEYGSSYRFYIVGVDYTGNREIKTNAETEVTILPSWDIRILQGLRDVYCVGDTFLLDFTTVMANDLTLHFSIDSGETSIPLIIGMDTTMRPFQWIIPDSLAGVNLQFYLWATDSIGISDTSQFFLVRPGPVVDAGDILHICPGEVRYLVPQGANNYYWYPQIGLNFQESTVQSIVADTSTMYYVIGTDENGCANIDSISIVVHDVTLDTILHLMCNQDSVYAEGAYQTQPGFYTDELASLYGCDSTVVTEVVLTGPCFFPSPQMYVDEDATGLNDGTSWVNAFNELSDALAASRLWSGVQEIWVAEGIYSPHPTQRDSSFILKDSIKIYGGFIGIENNRSERTADPELVFLSGDINITDTLWDNSYHTVMIDSSCVDCVLDGLTIHYGYANDPGHDTGAGVLNAGSGLIYNVIFERNYATELGAAVLSSGTLAHLLFQNCTFRLNTSSLGRDVVNINGSQVTFAGLNSLY